MKKLFKNKGILICVIVAGVGIFGGIGITEGRFVGWSEAAFNRIYAVGAGMIVVGALGVIGAGYYAVKSFSK